MRHVSLEVVLLYAFALRIHISEVGLSVSVALLMVHADDDLSVSLLQHRLNVLQTGIAVKLLD